MFDLIFSMVIIVISLGIVLSYFTNTSVNQDIFELNKQILKSFTQTKINSLNEQFIRDLFISGKIKNIKNTVAQQVSEFYYLKNYSLAKNLTKIYLKNYANPEINLNISLNNGTDTFVLFSKVNSGVIFKNSDIISVSKRSILGFINQTDYYGPYEIEVKTWV